MSARGATTRRRLRRAALVPAIGALAVALAAAPGGAQTRGNLPFARGQLVGRSGATLDIQGFNGDSKVIVTSSTKYEQMQTADATAVKVGQCIRVTGTGSASTGITATSVALSPAPSSCSTGNAPGAGFGGRFRNRTGNGNGNGGTTGGTGGGTGGTTGGTTGGPGGGTGTGNAGRNRANFPTNFGSVAGKVTKVSGDKVVVKGTIVQPPTKANGKPKTAKKTVNVTLASATRFDETVTATADALAVGTCVTAAGTADSVGTVTANTVIVSQPVNGSCTGGFGFGGGGRGRFGPNGGPDGGQNGTGSNGSTGTTGSTGSA